MSDPITPGEILIEEYLEPMGISQKAMAEAIGVPSRTISLIAQGKIAITPEMSIRFGAFFGQSEEFWHGIQSECDFRRLTSSKGTLTAGIRTAESLRGGF